MSINIHLTAISDICKRIQSGQPHYPKPSTDNRRYDDNGKIRK